MDKTFKLRMASSLKLGLFFAFLFMTAVLLSACSDSKLNESAGQNARSDDPKGRLCVSFANYDKSVDLKNLKAALNIRQQDVGAAVSRRTASGVQSSAGEEQIPFYSAAEKKALIAEKAQAALNYMEEPIVEELEDSTAEETACENAAELSEECGEDCAHEEAAEAVEDGVSLEAEEESAEELAPETAAPEPETAEADSAEAVKAAALNAKAVSEENAEAKGAKKSAAKRKAKVSGPAYKLSAESNTDAEAMHGKVFSAEASLDANNTLCFYFEIDNGLYPIDVDGLSVYNTAAGEDEAFLYIPLRTAAQNSKAAFKLDWRTERQLQSRRAAVANKAELRPESKYDEETDCDTDTDTDCDTDADTDTDTDCDTDADTDTDTDSDADADTDCDTDTDHHDWHIDCKIKLTGYDSCPERIVINYYQVPKQTKIKDLSYGSGFSYNEEDHTVLISVNDLWLTDSDHYDHHISILAINDMTNGLTCAPKIGFSDGERTVHTVDYSEFSPGFTQSPVVKVENVPSDAWVTYLYSYLCIRAHALRCSSEEKYNETSLVSNYGVSDDDNNYYYVFNMTCESPLDEVVVTRLECPDRYWEDMLTYWYGTNDLLTVSSDSFVKNRITDTDVESKYLYKLIVTDVDFMPAYCSVLFARRSCDYGDDGPINITYHSELPDTLKGVIYDESSRSLTVFCYIAGGYDGGLKEIVVDNHIYSCYIDGTSFLQGRMAVFSLSDFREDGSSGGVGNYNKEAEVQVLDMPYNPDRSAVYYTVGSDPTVRTVNIASYQNRTLTFGKIFTDDSYITVEKIEVGSYVYECSKKLDLSKTDSNVFRVSFDDSCFVLNPALIADYAVKLTAPCGAYVKVEYTEGDSKEIRTAEFKGSADSYDRDAGVNFNFELRSIKNEIDIKRIWINNRYKDLNGEIILKKSSPEMAWRYNLFGAYSSMSAETVNYCQSISGVNSKPASSRLYYTKYGSSSVYTVGGTYDSAAKAVNFRLKHNDDINITKIVVGSRIFTKGLTLNYLRPSNTVKLADMSTTNLLIKNVSSPANYIVVVYRLFNSNTGVFSELFKKTAGTYNSDNKTYTFTFTPSQLNDKDYNILIVKSVTLDNSVSVKDRSIAMGKTYDLLYSGLSAQNTRYAVNITNGTANVIGRKGTMEYTLPSGKSFTANGSVRYDPAAKRYVMHFDTVKTTAASIKVNRITVGNRYYGSSFTMKYGQNKNASNPNEGRNTRTIGMGSGFKACSVAYTVTLTNVPSSVTSAVMKWSTASGSYSSKSKYADGKIVFTPKTSADTLNVGTITAGSKKSVKAFALTPKKRTYSISYSSQMGKNGNKWVSQTCSACNVKGDGKCKTCQGSGKVACSAFKMSGASKCFSCNDTGKMNCPACAASKKCQTCAGKGKRNVLKAVS